MFEFGECLLRVCGLNYCGRLIGLFIVLLYFDLVTNSVVRLRAFSVYVFVIRYVN